MPSLKQSAQTKPRVFEFSRLEGSFRIPEDKAFQDSLKVLNRSIRDSVRILLKAYFDAVFIPGQEDQRQMKGFSPTNSSQSFRRHRDRLRDLGFGLPYGPDNLFDAYLMKTFETPIRTVYRDGDPASEDAAVAIAFREALGTLLKTLPSPRKKVANQRIHKRAIPKRSPSPPKVNIPEIPEEEKQPREEKMTEAEILERIKAAKAGHKF